MLTAIRREGLPYNQAMTESHSASSSEPNEDSIPQRDFSPPAGSTTVFLVRHGQTVPAIRGASFPMIDGQGNPELTELGHRQAERIADRLEGAGITSLWVSSMVRTQQSAAPLAQRIGVTPRVNPDLREVHLGEFEGGRLRFEVAAKNPIIERVFATGRHDYIPGAEPYEDLTARVRAAFESAVSADEGGTIALVVHAVVIRALLADLFHAPAPTFGLIANGGVSVVHRVGQRTLLGGHNDVSHLATDRSRS